MSRTLYKLVDNINGKIYIGSTSFVYDRVVQYRNPGTIRQSKLFQRLREVGFDNFTMYELAVGEDSEIRRMESELIIKHDSLWPNGYNMTRETRGGAVRKGK